MTADGAPPSGSPVRRWLFAAALAVASATSLVVTVEMVTRRLMRWRR